MARFKKGMKVRDTMYGIGGYTEVSEDVVESVKNGVVRTEGCENGITFDAVTGRELENFFPGIRREIAPLDEVSAPPKPAKTTKRARPMRAAKPEPRLTVADIANPMFDRQAPRERMVQGRRAIEWVTITDGFVKVGCTYYLDTGQLWVVAFEPRNLKLHDHPVFTPEQFARAMRNVDRNYRQRVGQ